MRNDNELIKVRLYRNNHPVAYCRANYIGTLGMQVNTGPILYQPGTVLDVELTLKKEDGNLNCTVPAMVTRRSNEELGLTFVIKYLQTYSDLIEIILASHKSAYAT